MPLKPSEKYIDEFASIVEEFNLGQEVGEIAGSLKAMGASERQIDDHLHRNYGFSKDFRKRNKIETVEPS